MDNNKIVALLGEVKDPKTGQDVISLRMIEDLKIDPPNVTFSIVIDGIEEKVKSHLNFACIEKINTFYPEAQVHIHLKSKSENHQKTKNRPLPQIKNIIAVASGKGGVGKSTISANLALALKEQGFKVGIMDADVYGPSMPTMMGIQGRKPEIQQLYGKHKIIPIEQYGLHIISIGNIIEPEQAIVLRGPRLGGIIKQFINDCIWPSLDYLIIDLPPGTGDIQLTCVQSIPITGVVMVTTPQEVAYVDAVKAMNMFLLDNVNVPILGVVENMSWFTPEELPDNKYYIFGQGAGEKLASKSGTMLLGAVPLVQGIRESGDQGKPAMLQEDSPMQKYFEEIGKNVALKVQQRNESQPATKIVEIKT